MKAEDMFKELGYKKEICNLEIIYSKDYENNPNNYKCVCFNIYNKTFSVYEVDNYDGYVKVVDIYFELLQAINKQVKELGW